MSCASSPPKQLRWVVFRPWLFACGICPFYTDHVYNGLRQRARAQRTVFRDINIMKKREEEIPQRRGHICAEFVAQPQSDMCGEMPTFSTKSKNPNNHEAGEYINTFSFSLLRKRWGFG